MGIFGGKAKPARAKRRPPSAKGVEGYQARTEWNWAREEAKRDPELRRAAAYKRLGYTPPNPIDEAKREAEAEGYRMVAEALRTDPAYRQQFLQAELDAKRGPGGGPFQQIESVLALVDRINERGGRDDDSRGGGGGWADNIAQILQAAGPLIQAAVQAQQTAALGFAAAQQAQLEAAGQVSQVPPVEGQMTMASAAPTATIAEVPAASQSVITAGQDGAPDALPEAPEDDPNSLAALLHQPPEQAAIAFWARMMEHLAEARPRSQEVAQALQILSSDWSWNQVYSLMKPVLAKNDEWRPLLERLHAQQEWTQAFRAQLRLLWLDAERASQAAAQAVASNGALVSSPVA